MIIDSDDELIRESDLRQLFGGVASFTIYRWRKDDPDFPKPDFVRTSADGRRWRYYTRRSIRLYREKKCQQ